MDTLRENQEVSLPSISHKEQLTIFERQNLIKQSQVESDNAEIHVTSDESEARDDNSDSDNEVDIVEPIKEKNLNFDDEFDKIASYKFRKLSEESADEVDHEIAEILSGKLVDTELKVEEIISETKDTDKENIDEKLENILSEQQQTETSVNVDSNPIESIKNDEELHVETTQDQTILQSDELPNETIAEHKADYLETSFVEPELKETIINGVKNNETLINEEQLAAQLISDENKPPVPIQTYLWEDLKKSREQGGYPWTHLYKQPLGPDEEPEIILKYSQSPRAVRRADNSEPNSPKSQKKVRIQDEIEVQETENYIQDLTDNDDDEDHESAPATSSTPVASQEATSSSDVKKSPKSILKRSQKILDTIKPSAPKFDSGSLKKKINNPLKKIKKMADEQFQKVKAKRTSIKKIPVEKGEIVLDEVKILKLKESPKSQHRDVAAYIVKQDSEDTVEILNLDESPNEVRKRREKEENETGLVKPDEIIELPSIQSESNIESAKAIEEELEKPERVSEESQEPTVDDILKEELKSEQKKREHVYEDIEDYVSKIAVGAEHAEPNEPKLQRQDEVNPSDPIFTDFTKEMKIRASLNSQDVRIQELFKRVPKIEELTKQISDEDKSEREEKSEEMSIQSLRQLNLLAPISSIDSTSSDEDRRAHLSILAEESETSDSNKKKSFDESSVEKDIESLKNDGSDISTTLIEDELKGYEERKEKSEEKTMPDVIGDLKESEEEKIETIEEKRVEIEESKEESPEIEETEEGVREDVIIKQNLEAAAAIKISKRWVKMSDHEYEPIGDPSQITENKTVDQPDQETQKRKGSDTMEQSASKLLRTPTEESEDNISAQDFQAQVEARFFHQEIKPIVDDEAHAVHQENTFEEAVIIDEEPVPREVPRKRTFISTAQEKGRNFNKKIKAQAGMIKTSLNNKIKKKPKEKPVAVEVAQVIETSEDAKDEETFEQPPETVTIKVPPPAESEQKSKTSLKMPKFTKNIKTPKMPDLKMGERFSSLRKLGRSKSLKETSEPTETASEVTPEPQPATAESAKKRFDFGTYPRFLKDKFKRPKLPERGDRSVRSDTPPVVEFTRVSQAATLQRGPVASRWPEYDQDSGKYQQFNSESDLDRETSVERRMREDFDRNTEEREDFEIVRRLMNEEQQQLDEMDKENQEIHLMAKQERYRKPFAESQESDDDKLMWSGDLNKDLKEDFDEPNALKFNNEYKFTLDDFKVAEINRSSTPQTNQETQSSGSSGTRRRKGFLEDDDDYFLRESRTSNEIQVGNYISSAIKEGLSVPDDNALAQMGGYDHSSKEMTPEKPIRSLKRRKNKSIEPEEHIEQEIIQKQESYDNEMGTFNDYYRTFPPNRPSRKPKPESNVDDSEEHDIVEEEIDLNVDREEPCNASDIIDVMNENNMFYHQQIMKGVEHPEMIIAKDDFDNDFEYNGSRLPVPPTPPRRRKKKIHHFEPHYSSLKHDRVTQKPKPVEKIIVYRSEHIVAPLIEQEQFSPPVPARRTRSRSQMSSHTLDDAESFKRDSTEAFNIQDKENGYAVVRKEVPSRPVRRKRSTKSLGDRQFATMPHIGREEVVPPPRPVRNYSTIIPNKPPRRKSASSLVEMSTTKIDDDYEEILDNGPEDVIAKRLQSGAIINKMKDRPLPPPPRPKRESKKQKKEEPSDDTFDKDDGAEKVIEPLEVETIENLLPVQNEIIETSDTNVGHEVSPFPRQDSDFSEPERVVEVEVSTQTDPVLDDDFECDDEEMDIEEFLSADGKLKTLEDILKEEQEAEMERARQLAEAENLSKGIQRFRDSNQRSMSERSRTSADRSRSLSRPITPSAVVVERKKSSPIIFNNQPSTVTEAGLFIHPITYDDYGRQPSDEEDQHLSEPVVDNLDHNNNLDANTQDIDEQQQLPEDEPIIEQNIDHFVEDETDEELLEQSIKSEDNELDSEMQRKIEEMIDSVLCSAQEEVEFLQSSNENIIDSDQKNENYDSENREEEVEIKTEDETEPQIKEEQILLQDEAPKPPPRRKSHVEDSEKTKESPKIEEEIEEMQMQPEEDQEIELEPEDLEKEDDMKSESQLISNNRLHLSNLEIDNLSVCSLQAGRITASEIDSNTITTNDFECRISSNLSNVQSIELPPGLIDVIVERVRCAERESQQRLQTEQAKNEIVPEINATIEVESPPERPPLPQQFSEFQAPIATTSFSQLRNNLEDEAAQPQSSHRRRRHIKRKDSTSEEEYQKEQKSRARVTSAPEPTVLASGGQFLRACGNAISESGSTLMEILRASSKDENKRDLHIALIILIVIVAGLILLSMGEKSVHHHHWDFFNPPENPGRK